MTAALAEPFRDSGITKVASVEARGFAIGAAVGSSLSAGFVAVRKHGAIHPGAKVRVPTDTDWRGLVNELEPLRASLEPQDRVLVVDERQRRQRRRRDRIVRFWATRRIAGNSSRLWPAPVATQVSAESAT
jgi:hypothetical protein